MTQWQRCEITTTVLCWIPSSVIYPDYTTINQLKRPVIRIWNVYIDTKFCVIENPFCFVSSRFEYRYKR